MDEKLFRVLAESVGRYLEWVDRLAGVEEAGQRPVAVEARRLVAAWRALLELHSQTGGRCGGCARGHRRMCGVWRVACAYFVRRPGTISSRRRGR